MNLANDKVKVIENVKSNEITLTKKDIKKDLKGVVNKIQDYLLKSKNLNKITVEYFTSLKNIVTVKKISFDNNVLSYENMFNFIVSLDNLHKPVIKPITELSYKNIEISLKKLWGISSQLNSKNKINEILILKSFGKKGDWEIIKKDESKETKKDNKKNDIQEKDLINEPTDQMLKDAEKALEIEQPKPKKRRGRKNKKTNNEDNK